MSTDPRDPGDSGEPLIEAALTATEGGDVDWELLRDRMPDEQETIDALAELTAVVAAHRAPAHGERAAGEGLPFRWGPLEVRRRVGAGTFGEVFIAWDARLHREVALKLRHAGAGERVRGWLEEARRLARVRHPNVVTVHGADLHDGRVGMWMEPVRGRTLEERLRHEGPLSAREAALIGAEVCAALAAVHGAGLVHGDVKTHNIMREGTPGQPREAGRIVLMDFGSARESAAGTEHRPGTPLFTAPEVLDGAPTTPASDVWALGVVLYRLVTGGWPVEAATVEALRERLATTGPAPLRAARSELPQGFVHVVERALERDPARRWRDAAEFERALLGALGADRELAAEEGRRRDAARRRTRLLASIALGAVLGAALWWGVTHGERAWMAWRMRTLPLVGTLAADVTGKSANAYLGSWVIDVGDMNGDGHDEVAAAASGMEKGGEVYVYSPEIDPTLTPILTVKGEQEGDWFGSVASGDLNGDGYQDLIVGAITHDGVARDAGRVYVYFGGRTLHATPDRVLDGTHAAQYFGYGVGAGDINGDHYDDLLIGAVYDNKAGPTTGRAWVYFGGPTFDTVPDLELAQGVDNSNFGLSVAPLGDFNGDGYGDFAVGAPGHPGGGHGRGAAFLYFGGPHPDDRPDMVLYGTQDQGGFGAVRQRTGDLNGDGYSDLAIASETGDGLEKRAGNVRIWFGGPDPNNVPDLELKGEKRGDGFGVWVDGSRDLDGDGLADIVVGAPWHDAPGGRNNGRLYVYLGGRHMDAVPDYIVDGPPNANLGTGCCAVRDPKGGVGAIMGGLKNEDGHFIQCGGVQLFDLSRWAIRTPSPRDDWAPGQRAVLRWIGPTRCDVLLSTDDGRTWRTIARHVGGYAHNAIAVPVPADARGHVRVRLTGRSGRDAVESQMPISG